MLGAYVVDFLWYSLVVFVPGMTINDFCWLSIDDIGINSRRNHYYCLITYDLCWEVLFFQEKRDKVLISFYGIKCCMPFFYLIWQPERGTQNCACYFAFIFASFPIQSSHFPWCINFNFILFAGCISLFKLRTLFSIFAIIIHNVLIIMN